MSVMGMERAKNPDTDELSGEELDAEEMLPLPDREAMTVLSGPGVSPMPIDTAMPPHPVAEPLPPNEM